VSCEGSGVRPEARCKSCAGQGSVPRKQQLLVKIPAGVEDGAVRTLSGMGEEAKSGAGSLHVHVTVNPHPLFVREGADILCDVPEQLAREMGTETHPQQQGFLDKLRGLFE